MEHEQEITIRDLYPQMTDDELAVAEINLKRYLAAVLRIHDRLKREGKTWPARPTSAGFDSTEEASYDSD